MLAIKRVTPIVRKPTTRKQASLDNSQRLVREAWQAIDAYYESVGEERREVKKTNFAHLGFSHWNAL